MFKIILTEIFVLIISWSLLAMEENNFSLGNEELNIAASQNDAKKIKSILQSLPTGDDPFEIARLSEAAVKCTHDEDCLKSLYRTKSDSEERFLSPMIAQISEHLIMDEKKCPKEILAIVVEYVVSYSTTQDKIDSLFRRKRSNTSSTKTMDASFRLGKESDFIKALKESKFHIAETILDGGLVNFNFKDERTSMLHIASAMGITGIVKKLMENGASVDALNDKGETPLMLASDNLRLNVVKLLLESHADPEICDSYGRTSANRTMCKGILELLNAHANEKRTAKKSKTARDI